MTDHLQTAATAIRSEIKRLEAVLASLDGGGSGTTFGGGETPTVGGVVSAGKSPKAVKTAKPAKGKRTRRSSEDVVKQAEDMVVFIKSKGKTGASAGDVLKEFGPVKPSVRDFITKRIKDVKLKKTGAGIATKYTVGD